MIYLEDGAKLQNNVTYLVTLLDNAILAAGEAELVDQVTWTLHEVCVLQLARTVGALQDGCTISTKFVVAMTVA